MDRSVVFPTLTIIGAGLIGSSIARAARRAWPDCSIRLGDRDPAVLAQAQALALADRYSQDPRDLVAQTDLLILAVPGGAMESLARALSDALSRETLVTDVASVKGALVEPLSKIFRNPYVPSHPIAGTENSGPDAGFATLFSNRWVILTPISEKLEAEVVRLTRFWCCLGARVEIMDPDHHDQVLAMTSHVPHLIAYAIVRTASQVEQVTKNEVIKFSAAGFRDFTRIAASDPIMWRDVFLQNKTATLELLALVKSEIAHLEGLIAASDGDALRELFAQTRKIRRSILAAGQDQPQFGRDLAEAKVKASVPIGERGT